MLHGDEEHIQFQELLWPMGHPELYRDNGQENGNCYNGLYRDYIRVLLWGYIGKMEKNMETTKTRVDEECQERTWCKLQAWSLACNSIDPQFGGI